jgi:hypothetical protein
VEDLGEAPFSNSPGICCRKYEANDHYAYEEMLSDLKKWLQKVIPQFEQLSSYPRSYP